MDTIIELLIPVLLAMLEQCIEQNTSEAEIMKRLENPTLRDWLRLWLNLRRAGASRQEASAAIEKVRKTTWGKEQLQDLIDEAKAR